MFNVLRRRAWSGAYTNNARSMDRALTGFFRIDLLLVWLYGDYCRLAGF